MQIGRRKKAVRYCCNLAFLTTLLISSCSSGSNSTSSGTGPTTTVPGAPAAASLIYEFQTTTTPSNIIDSFSATASGAASPVATLTLPTGVVPASLVTDSTGQIYVGCQGVMGNVVLVYTSGSTGNATPSRAVDVSSAPFEIAVDASGLLYVAVVDAAGTPGISVYSATATGSSAPLRTISTPGIQVATALATDSSGSLYVAGETPSDGGYRGYIAIYPPGASGSATPSRTIQSSFNFYGLTVDTSGDLFATTDGPNEERLVEYSSSASGAAVPTNTFTLATPITNTSFIGNVVQDAAGNFYFAVSDTPSGVSKPTLTIYTLGPGFSSTSNPVRTFSPTTSTDPQIAVN